MFPVQAPEEEVLRDAEEESDAETESRAKNEGTLVAVAATMLESIQKRDDFMLSPTAKECCGLP